MTTVAGCGLFLLVGLRHDSLMTSGCCMQNPNPTGLTEVFWMTSYHSQCLKASEMVPGCEKVTRECTPSPCKPQRWFPGWTISFLTIPHSWIRRINTIKIFILLTAKWRVNVILIKFSMAFSTEIEKKYCKFHMKV